MKLVNIKFLIIFLIAFKANMINAQLVKENLFALPTYTYTNFSGVSSPNTGSLVYNLTDNKLYFYNGSLWVLVDSDSTFLSNRINLRLKYTDTAAMLTPYFRKGDTANMLSKYIYNANNGLIKSGKTVQLGGTLSQATTVTTGSTNTLALAGLQSGSKTNDSLLVAVASTGVIKRISPSNLMVGYMKYTDTAAMLSKYLRKGDTSAMLSKYLRKGDTSAMLNKYIYNGNNGLTKSGKTLQLGGTLTQATTITTTSSNTLTLAGLGSGLSTDSVLTVNTAGLIKKKSNFPLVLNKTASYTLAVSDHSAIITINSSSATTLTIPTGLPIGFNISVYQLGTGKITIAGASGVTLKNRLSRFKTSGKDAGVGIIITASNTAHLTGDLAK